MSIYAKGAGLLGDAVSGGVKTADGLLDNIKDLMFLHNTSADKLARQESMGGMPMPSIAVTQKDIPFTGYGDITLVGNPSNFDPKTSKLNQAFSADAYTVRSPQPVQVSRKGAGKAFDTKYGAKLKELGIYGEEVIANIWDLEAKGDVDPSKYRNIINFFDNKNNTFALFLDSKGIKVNADSSLAREENSDLIKPYLKSGEFNQWKVDQIDEIFNPEQWFVSNPNRDYYTTKAKLKPYSADEVTKFMKRSAGRNTEGGMASSSVGGVRAATTEQFKNLQGMRDMKGSLVSSSDMAEFKQTSDMMLDDLSEAFKSNYKYDADSWHYQDEFRDFVKLSETKGIKAAAEEVGFNPSKELAQELNQYKDMLRSGPTEYFESKPKRVVDFNEFAGAIIPESTDDQTRRLLKRYGIRTEEYTDEASNLAARNKFKSEMFTNPAATVGTGLLGLGALSQSNDTYADYSPSNLARLKSDDVGSYQAAQNPQLARAAGIMGQINKHGVDDPLMGFVAPRIPSELLNKMAYDDKRGLLDYAKAYAGLLGLY